MVQPNSLYGGQVGCVRCPGERPQERRQGGPRIGRGRGDALPAHESLGLFGATERRQHQQLLPSPDARVALPASPAPPARPAPPPTRPAPLPDPPPPAAPHPSPPPTR